MRALVGPAVTPNFSSSSAAPGWLARSATRITPAAPCNLGVGGFGGELRVLGKGLAFEDALGVRSPAVRGADQDDLAFDVEAGVVVVAVFRRGDAVAGEDHGAGQRAGFARN